MASKPTFPSPPRALALGLSLLALITVATGCRSASGSGATPTTARRTTTTAATSTTVDLSTLKQRVADAYQAADKANLDAESIPDPTFPALLATHVGPMLDQRQKVLRSFQLEGLIGRLPTDSRYRNKVDLDSMRIDGDVAMFNVCAVDDSQRVDKATGRVVGGSGVDTYLVQVAMRRVAGVWKLAERKQLQQWSGEAGCAAS